MPNRGKTCELGASGPISICRGIWMDALILSQTRHMSSQKTSNNNFLTILMEFKFPSGYVGPLSSRIANGKLRGLKTRDFHILLQQVLPLCLKNVGNSKVVGAIMRVSRLFRNICSKVVDSNQKFLMLEDVAETICSLEKELPPSTFVIMLHLPLHLVEELYICGPVHTRWM